MLFLWFFVFYHVGFMHRDIKPENVFLDEKRNVLLGDFGLGGKWCSLAPTNATCGSLNYAGLNCHIFVSA